MARRKKRVKNFVIQLETFNKGEWRGVVRYNYSHGFPHRDLIFYDGRKVKERIKEDDLSRVVNLAIGEIKRNWRGFLRRCGYEKGKK